METYLDLSYSSVCYHISLKSPVVEMASGMLDPGAKSVICVSLCLFYFLPCLFHCQGDFSCDGKVTTQQHQTSALLVTSARPKSNSQQLQQNPRLTFIYLLVHMPTPEPVTWPRECCSPTFRRRIA